MTDQKNTLLAIVLSALVLIAWQLYFGLPQLEKQKQIAQQQAEQHQQAAPRTPPPQTGAPTQPAPGAAPQAPAQPAPIAPAATTRAAALAASPRVRIDTPDLAGSVSLKGARIDDLSLIKYHETVEPNSPPVVLLSPSASPEPFYS